jgi:alpha-mannosidase
MLTPEWRRRIDNWRNELKNHFYRELGKVPLSGFVTRDQLSVDEACRFGFRPTPPGTEWGAKWEYGWFRGEVVLPEAAEGRRICFMPDVGAEGAVYVNRKPVGSVDLHHRVITLAMSGVPGVRYEVVVEGYAGHGPKVFSTGPTPPGRVTVPEPGPTQAVVGESTFGVWQEEAYQLWLDVETLYEVRDNIDQDSLRVAEIDRGLRDFTVVVDFEVPHEEFLETVGACREMLGPLLDCVNGSTAPTLYAFGHAHIDVAWLWPLAETERKCVRTFSNQLSLMGEYPEYRFLQSQPQLYHMVKTHYPGLYESVKEAVRGGVIVPEGGMWVESDTNIPGGESLVRQFLHGKRFFREEFGVDCELLWLPDVFGYSGSLPQIMRGCGIRYFSSHKIFWTYSGGDPFPYNTFVWEGIDGSEVLVHLHNDYNSHTNPATVIDRWRERIQKDGFSTRLFPFGHGDGGGGPTRTHLEFLRRQGDLEGVPRVKIASPIEYFKDQETEGTTARYVGELYFQAHRGTYTSQARTKRGNRKSEFALREAEMWATAASALRGFEFLVEAMDGAWKAVLLNQFHDIIPGSSIHRVYEEAEAAYASVMETARGIVGGATSAITDGSEALTVFNSLSWHRNSIVALPKGSEGVLDDSGEVLPTQRMGDRSWVEVTVPSCGWTTLRPGRPHDVENTLGVTGRVLENECLRLEFNGRGEITSIFDKEAGSELAAGPCNSLRMYRDVPTAWDAWDIDSMYGLSPVALEEPAEIEVVARGPLVVRLRIRRKLNESTMTQEVSLRRGSRRVDFHTVVDWCESHKLLKVNFPVAVHANEAVHEIQFGHIRRPNHMSRPFDADRFEVPAQKWTALMEEGRGCAVLNDCKYGVNVLGNSINLTLLRAPLAPDMTADKGRQEFTYAFYAWNGGFAEIPIVHEAYELNCPVTSAPGAAGTGSLFGVSAPNVIVEAVKPAEDGSGDVIVRMYESKRMATKCILTTSLSFVDAIETNLLEENRGEVASGPGMVELEFRPFEVKTIRLTRK